MVVIVFSELVFYKSPGVNQYSVTYLYVNTINDSNHAFSANTTASSFELTLLRWSAQVDVIPKPAFFKSASTIVQILYRPKYGAKSFIGRSFTF